MACVVFLKGINVGGHRTFRPAALAAELNHLGAVNIGAAGTFVIPRPVTRTKLRAELVRRLPFDAHIAICDGCDVIKLMAGDPFAGEPARPGIVRFVSVFAGRPRETPSIPLTLPPTGNWLVKILARHNRLVVGVYQRQMRVIGYLSSLDRVFGVPVTTRNWNTMTAVAKTLQKSRPLRRA